MGHDRKRIAKGKKLPVSNLNGSLLNSALTSPDIRGRPTSAPVAAGKSETSKLSIKPAVDKTSHQDLQSQAPKCAPEADMGMAALIAADAKSTQISTPRPSNSPETGGLSSNSAMSNSNHQDQGRDDKHHVQAAGNETAAPPSVDTKKSPFAFLRSEGSTAKPSRGLFDGLSLSSDNQYKQGDGIKWRPGAKVNNPGQPDRPAEAKTRQPSIFDRVHQGKTHGSDAPKFSFSVSSPSCSQVFWKPKPDETPSQKVGTSQALHMKEVQFPAFKNTQDGAAIGNDTKSSEAFSTTKNLATSHTNAQRGSSTQPWADGPSSKPDDIGEADYVDPCRLAKRTPPAHEVNGPESLSQGPSPVPDPIFKYHPGVAESIIFQGNLGSSASLPTSSSAAQGSTDSADPALSLKKPDTQASTQPSAVPKARDEPLKLNPGRQSATEFRFDPSFIEVPADHEAIFTSHWNHNKEDPQKATSIRTVRQFTGRPTSSRLRRNPKDLFATLDKEGPVYPHIPDTHKRLTDLEMLKIMEACIMDERLKAKLNNERLMAIVAYSTVMVGLFLIAHGLRLSEFIVLLLAFLITFAQIGIVPVFGNDTDP